MIFSLFSHHWLQQRMWVFSLANKSSLRWYTRYTWLRFSLSLSQWKKTFASNKKSWKSTKPTVALCHTVPSSSVDIQLYYNIDIWQHSGFCVQRYLDIAPWLQNKSSDWREVWDAWCANHILPRSLLFVEAHLRSASIVGKSGLFNRLVHWCELRWYGEEEMRIAVVDLMVVKTRFSVETMVITCSGCGSHLPLVAALGMDAPPPHPPQDLPIHHKPCVW